MEEVEVICRAEDYALPPEERAAYRSYIQEDPQRFRQERTVYMLVRNPKAFSDAPKLTPEIQKTRFSVVWYFQERIVIIKRRRDNYLTDMIANGTIRFPHSLCIHAVVITKDERVLVTKRSPKVEYIPGAWSVSVEEQVSPDDLPPGTNGLVKRWAQRLLLEELAVQAQDYDIRNVRLLSVFLEGDIMNCSIAAVLPETLHSNELNDILEAMPRTDYERTEWKFLSYKEFGSQPRTPSLLHHPSSGYRMVLALANRYGAWRVADVMFPQ